MAKSLPGLTRQAPKIKEGAIPNAQTKRRKPRPQKAAPTAKEVHSVIGEVLPPETEENTLIERLAKARIIVERRANWAVVGGAVPIPVIDAITISAVQLAMLNELSTHYKIPFERNRGKAVISSLVGGILPYLAGVGVSGMLMKTMPIIGWAAGIATAALLGGSTTRAIGNVFIQHFEAGGTLLDFDPIATRDYFRQEFRKAKSR
jgi:uncharacterized protein (DUF697 family)